MTFDLLSVGREEDSPLSRKQNVEIAFQSMSRFAPSGITRFLIRVWLLMCCNRGCLAQHQSAKRINVYCLFPTSLLPREQIKLLPPLEASFVSHASDFPRFFRFFSFLFAFLPSPAQRRLKRLPLNPMRRNETQRELESMLQIYRCCFFKKQKKTARRRETHSASSAAWITIFIAI